MDYLSYSVLVAIKNLEILVCRPFIFHGPSVKQGVISALPGLLRWRLQGRIYAGEIFQPHQLRRQREHRPYLGNLGWILAGNKYPVSAFEFSPSQFLESVYLGFYLVDYCCVIYNLLLA